MVVVEACAQQLLIVFRAGQQVRPVFAQLGLHPGAGVFRRLDGAFDVFQLLLQGGDLGAVVTAIFLDPEARLGFLSDQTVYGKLKEPLLRLSQLLRAFEASSRSGIYGVGRTQAAYAQAPLGANSVFNFFSPQFQQPGPIKNAGYYSPEFQLQTETQGVLIVDNLGKRIALISATAGDNDPVLDLSSLVAEAADSSAMLDDLNVLMLGGSMSTSLRDIAARAIALTPDAGDEASRLKRAQIAVTVIAVSPEYAVQR